ncbi:MAG: M15 family metallopeptidase [Acutalibacteraceae bacterium]
MKIKILLFFIPVLIVVVLLFGFVLGYESFSENSTLAKASEPVTEPYENDDMFLRTVNSGNPLDKSYVPKLEKVGDIEVCYYVAPYLSELLDKAEKDGVSLYVNRGYISFEEQKKMYDDTVATIRRTKKVSAVRAASYAMKTVGNAGESENQLGLVVKFSTDEKGDFKDSKAYAWLMKNAVNYGFIERYLSSNIQLSGMNADPTVFRFVSKENAEVVRNFDMNFEELVNYLTAK